MSQEISKMIKHQARELDHLIEVLPTKLGAEAVKFSVQRFRSQNWKGNSRQPWKKRKGRTDKGRAVLVKSGRLRRSIRVLGVRRAHNQVN